MKYSGYNSAVVQLDEDITFNQPEITSDELRDPAFTPIMNPDAAYQASTTKIDISALPNFTNVTSITDGFQVVTFSSPMQKRTVPGGGWATWSSPPFSESATPGVLFLIDKTTITLTLSHPAIIFGFELEPNPFAEFTFTADFFSGSVLVGSITRAVNGSAGARLFAAAEKDVVFSRIVITGPVDFAIAQVRYKSHDDCSACMSILLDANCRRNFGLDTCNSPNNPIPTCICHDICVEEVRLIGTASGNCEFTQCFNFPPIGPCRLGVGIALPVIATNQPLKVFVVCAQEVLSADCRVINVQVKILILASTTTGGNILLPLNVNVRFDTFFRFPECTGPVRNDQLQNALADIDGSCLVIQLKAQAVSLGTTTQIIISGKIIDKLWKNENLWVTGIRPYYLSDAQRNEGFVSFTVHDVFNNSHKISDCGPFPGSGAKNKAMI